MAQLSPNDISSLSTHGRAGQWGQSTLWIKTELGACLLLLNLVQAVFTVLSSLQMVLDPKNVLEDLL